MKPEYCTQNDGNCRECSLTNYGRNCVNIPLDELEHLKGVDDEPSNTD